MDENTQLAMPNFWLNAIRSLESISRFADAEQKALLWTQSDPGNAQAWHTLATVRGHQKNFKGAVESATICIQHASAEPYAWWHRGYLYLFFRLPSFAEDDFEKCINVSKSTDDDQYLEVSYLMRATARMHLGDYNGCIDDCACVSVETVFWLNEKITKDVLIKHSRACLKYSAA